MKISAHVTDTCLPDYYSGDHRPHVMIPVHSLMTTGEFRKAIMDELRWGYVSGNDEDSSLMRADFIMDECKQSRADEIFKKIYPAINRDIKSKKGVKYPFRRTIEKDNNDCVCVVVFIIED